MSCCDSASQPTCPCGNTPCPQVISNPPGLAAIAYRVGDFTGFREAMLRPLPGETALTQTDGGKVTQVWRPGADGDLAVQLLEWWAYLADILTFYNERVANQAYLTTADLAESVNRLIRLLGYRPRPGIGASGVLAALANSTSSFTLPAGFAVQSKPGPGQQPQIFELSAVATITPPAGQPSTHAVQGIATVEPVPGKITAGKSTDGNTAFVALAGSLSAVKVGDRVLLLQGPLPVNPVGAFVMTTVLSVNHEKAPQGNAYTSIGCKASDLTNVADLTSWHLLTSHQSTQVWQYPANDNLVMIPSSSPPSLTMHLISVIRSLKSGDLLVLEGPDPFLPWCTNLSSSTEALWFANPPDNNPAHPPTGNGAVPVPIPHTQITFNFPTADKVTDTQANRPNYLIRYGWKDVGPLIAVPTLTVGGGSGPAGAGAGATTPLSLQTNDGTQLPPQAGTAVLVEDVNGNGAAGTVNKSGGIDLEAPQLVPPLRALVNLLTMTRGKTVNNEVLGSGNALIPSQDFALQNKPVTYLSDPNSLSGDNYSSTVRVWVNQLEWTEVPSFYGQPPDAQVFLTREDEQGYTHVVFGSRLPTGINNVVAGYRYGSGAAVPAPGTLTVVLQPVPGLQAIRNPVPPSGGSDPDPPARVRRLAPRSVMTFNRAVSVDDFAVIAASTPGVVRAKAAVAFDPLAQRPRVTVWVGDDPGTVGLVQSAFAASADPNRLPSVVLANPVIMTLSLTVVHDPRYQDAVVQDAVQRALLDPDTGLFGVNVVDIGQVFYDSQIYAACLAAPGVTAVHSLSFARYERYHPLMLRFGGSGSPAGCNQRHDPGEGAYLLVPNDPAYFSLTVEAAS